MRELGSREDAELPQVWQRPALGLRPPGSSLRNETKHSACTTNGRWKTSGHIPKPAEEAAKGLFPAYLRQPPVCAAPSEAGPGTGEPGATAARTPPNSLTNRT